MTDYERLIQESRNRQIKITKKTLKIIENLFSDVSKDLGAKIISSDVNSFGERFYKNYQKQINKILNQMKLSQYEFIK